MSKERLEEIKQYYSRMESLDEYTQRDIKWLIEQAERAQELEGENKLLRFITEENKIAHEQKVKQNKRYQKALELIKLKTQDIKENKDTRPFQIYGIASEALEGDSSE